MINIMALKGSQNSGGNTNTILQQTITGLKDGLNRINKKWDIYSVSPNNLDILPCQNCGFCQQQSQCKIEDDFDLFLKKILTTEILVLATPVYFSGLPAQLKAIIDRCQVIWAAKKRNDTELITKLKQKKGFLIATAGAPPYEEQFVGVQAVTKIFFKTVNTEFIDEMTVANTDKFPPKEQEEILDKAYKMGLNLILKYF